MRKIIVLLKMFLLNGCAESVAFLVLNLEIKWKNKSSVKFSNKLWRKKHKTGKGPLEHVKAYAEKKNLEKKNKSHA